MKDYSVQTLANPSLIKRFSHHARFRQALKLARPASGACVLDYGAGDGSLTRMLAKQDSQASYTVFEPYDKLREQASANLADSPAQITVIGDIHSAESRYYDIVICQEVLEHLPDKLKDEALDEFERLLSPGGVLIVSVPVEIGLSALFKNLVRVLVRQAHESSSLINFLRATLGKCKNIPRISRNGYIDSHLGFDYRELEKNLLARNWVIEKQLFSPLPVFGGLFNSQVFYCLRRF